MIELVTCLSRESGIPAHDLVSSFGRYLFGRSHQTFPMYFEGVRTTFDFLRQVQDYILVEVHKLYPDAELPSFAHETPAPDRFVLIYHSSRPFSILAEGLIKGCIAHFGEPIDLAVEDLSGGMDTSARFLLSKRAAAARARSSVFSAASNGKSARANPPRRSQKRRRARSTRRILLTILHDQTSAARSARPIS
jgi:hypothetical protein